LGYPYCDSSRVRFQIISVLSRLPERSMLGLEKGQHTRYPHVNIAELNAVYSALISFVQRGPVDASWHSQEMGIEHTSPSKWPSW